MSKNAHENTHVRPRSTLLVQVGGAWLIRRARRAPCWKRETPAPSISVTRHDAVLGRSRVVTRVLALWASPTPLSQMKPQEPDGPRKRYTKRQKEIQHGPKQLQQYTAAQHEDALGESFTRGGVRRINPHCALHPTMPGTTNSTRRSPRPARCRTRWHSSRLTRSCRSARSVLTRSSGIVGYS